MKPEWKDAPEWANWLAQDLGGSWYWYEDKPTSNGFAWGYGGRCVFVGNSVSVNRREWRNTLEKRPMTNYNEILNAHEAAIACGNGEALECSLLAMDSWKPLKKDHESFSANFKYRHVKRTITVNGHEVPEPMKDEPTYDTIYYVPDPTVDNTPWQCRWIGAAKDVALLRLGLCHATMEAAIQHGKALADKGA